MRWSKFQTVSQRRYVSLAILCVACLVFGPAAFGEQAPSQMLNQYRNQRITWMTNVWPYANNLFFWLALIEFTWSAALMVVEKTDLQSWTAALIRKVMWIGAFYALLINGRNWIPTIVDSFNILGQQASGSGPMSPSDVFMRGLNIAGALMDGASSSAFLKNPGTSLACVVAAALTVLAFIGVTIQFVVAMVESYIIVAAGVIFLGFGGSRWTAPYVERYIGLGVSNGVKIMLLYLLIGVGMNISLEWIPDAQAVATSATPAMDAFEVMGAALIFLTLCWQVPKLFSAVLGGSPALTGGDLLSTGTGVAAGTAAIATVAAGGVALAARGAAVLGDVSVAAGAGAGGSSVCSGVMNVGSAARAGGGSSGAGGGTVPPPPSPPSGSPSNGRPRQPDPAPLNGGSWAGGAESSASIGTIATSRNGFSRSYGSNGNRTVDASVRTALSAVGGDSLAGSGFETERPAAGFTPVSAPMRGTSAPYVPPPPAPVPSAGSTDVSATEVTSSAAARVVGRFADGAAVARTIEGTSSIESGNGRTVPRPNGGIRNEARQASAQSGHSARPDVDSVQSNGSSDQQPRGTSRRERIGSTARKADQVFSGAVNRLRGLRNQLGDLPSDAAPHTPPPRMPIDHHD